MVGIKEIVDQARQVIAGAFELPPEQRQALDQAYEVIARIQVIAGVPMFPSAIETKEGTFGAIRVKPDQVEAIRSCLNGEFGGLYKKQGNRVEVDADGNVSILLNRNRG